MYLILDLIIIIIIIILKDNYLKIRHFLHKQQEMNKPIMKKGRGGIIKNENQTGN